MIDGHQLTSVWHIDNLKIIHKDEIVVTNIMSKLDAEYGKEASGDPAPLTVECDKIQKYLGMILDNTEAKNVKNDMTGYLEQKSNNFPDGYEGAAATPATRHLFKINEEY